MNEGNNKPHNDQYKIKVMCVCKNLYTISALQDGKWRSLTFMPCLKIRKRKKIIYIFSQTQRGKFLLDKSERERALLPSMSVKFMR